MNDLKTCFYTPSWPVFWVDNHLLVLYKPAGLLVQGDQSGEVSLLELGKAWLKQRYRKPGRVFLALVQRLDRPVAGVMLFCRTSKAAARLSEQLRLRKVRKSYLAVVEGIPRQPAARLIHHLERQERCSRVVASPTAHSQEARLSYRVLDTNRSRALLRIQLETGRRHQIRLQLAQLGHPIVGDVRYGAADPLPARQIALLARELTFRHPTRDEMLNFQSPLPRHWPWPDDQPAATAPPWNWDDLYPLIRPALLSGCSVAPVR